MLIGILPGEPIQSLRPHGPKIAIFNHRKDKAGALEPVFQLKELRFNPPLS